SLSSMNGLGAIVSGRDMGTESPLPARQIILWSPQTDAHILAGGKDSGGTLPRYSITDVGTLPGDIESDAIGLNDKGEVVGESIATHIDDGQAVGHGFVWKAGLMYDLGVTHGYQTSTAFRINKNDQIAGTVENNGQPVTIKTISRACWWHSGAIHVLPLGPLAVWDMAVGINDHCAIIGTLSLPMTRMMPVMHAALWRNGRLRDLGILPGFPSASAVAINAQEDIVCNSERFENVESQVRLLSRAYLWQNGKKTDLGLLPGCNSSRANKINDAGEIIGQCSAETFARPIGPQRAFVWQNHHMVELNGLEGSVSSSPFGINDLGDIVGIGSLPTPGVGFDMQSATDFPSPDDGSTNLDALTTTAVLWRTGRAYDLNSLIPADSGWHLTSANAVNNRGQIVGQGVQDGKKRGYLLTPIL
ncbi:MAG: DUF3466 family protein, partial [Janthinobacterium lividum]